MTLETALAIVLYFNDRKIFIRELTNKEQAAFIRAKDFIFQHAIRELTNTGVY